MHDSKTADRVQRMFFSEDPRTTRDIVLTAELVRLCMEGDHTDRLKAE
jgi:hypothetical protein